MDAVVTREETVWCTPPVPACCRRRFRRSPPRGRGGGELRFPSLERARQPAGPAAALHWPSYAGALLATAALTVIATPALPPGTFGSGRRAWWGDAITRPPAPGACRLTCVVRQCGSSATATSSHSAEQVVAWHGAGAPRAGAATTRWWRGAEVVAAEDTAVAEHVRHALARERGRRHNHRQGRLRGAHRGAPACSRGLGTASTAARSRDGSGCTYTCDEVIEACPSRSATTSMPPPASARLLP